MAERGNAKADKILQTGTCLVLDKEIVELFDCKPEDLFQGKPPTYTVIIPGLRHIPFCEAVKDVNGDFVKIPENRLTQNQRIWVTIIKKMQKWAIPTWGQGKPRSIQIGTSDVANAWTDGENYICFTKEFLGKHSIANQDRPCLHSLMRVATVLMHEHAHDNDSSSTANHGPAFDKEFRRLAESAFVENAVVPCLSWLTPGELQRLKTTSSKKEKQGMQTANEQEQRMVASVNTAQTLSQETPKQETSGLETPKQETSTPETSQEKPTQKKPKQKQKTSKPKADQKLTAKNASMETCEQAWKLREAGQSWATIEKTLALREANGMTAYRCSGKWQASLKEEVTA
jgi:hypothetical protein